VTEKQQLIKKVTGVLRAARVPKHLNRFGPKRFTTAQLVLGLAVREAYRLSYRRASDFLAEWAGIQLHWTTLQKFCSRVSARLWQGLLRASAQLESMLAAIDATGFSRSNPSFHYLRRIDGKTPAAPVKLSALVDIDTRKVLAARVRLRVAGDTKDVMGLVRSAHKKPWSVVMDKGYDSEPLLEKLDSLGVWGIAPPRANAKNGWLRKKLLRGFPTSTYNQRSIVEAVFSSIKRLYGGHVRARKAHGVRAEVYIKLILYNLIASLLKDFLQSPFTPNHFSYINPSTTTPNKH